MPRSLFALAFAAGLALAGPHVARAADSPMGNGAMGHDTAMGHGSAMGHDTAMGHGSEMGHGSAMGHGAMGHGAMGHDSKKKTQ